MFISYLKIGTLWYTSISDRYSKESEWVSMLRGWIMDSETSGNCAAVIVAVIRKRR